MSAAVVALIMSLIAAVVFFISAGPDRIRMGIGAIWGLVLGATIGGTVTGSLGQAFGAVGKLFGA